MANREIPFPDVASIAWIPAYRPFASVPSAGVHLLNRKVNSPFFKCGLRLMFRYGNPPPPLDLGGSDAGFLAYLGTQEYRGAMELSQVKLICDGDRPIDVSYETLDQRKIAGFSVFREGRVVKFLPGKGSNLGVSVRLDSSGATIRYLVQFQMGLLATTANLLLFWGFPVRAWMGMEYRINVDRSFAAVLSGTYVPTQTTLVGWGIRASEYSMLQSDDFELAAFLGGGYNTLGNERPGKSI